MKAIQEDLESLMIYLEDKRDNSEEIIELSPSDIDLIVEALEFYKEDLD